MAVATPIVYQTSEEVDCGARGRKGVGGARWEAAEVGGCGGKGKARVGSVIEVGKVEDQRLVRTCPSNSWKSSPPAAVVHPRSKNW